MMFKVGDTVKVSDNKINEFSNKRIIGECGKVISLNYGRIGVDFGKELGSYTWTLEGADKIDKPTARYFSYDMLELYNENEVELL